MVPSEREEKAESIAKKRVRKKKVKAVGRHRSV